jgi:methylglyoxal synthase
MPSSRKQINTRPHPDDYELIVRFAKHWNVPKSVAMERLAIAGAQEMLPKLQQVSTSASQFSNSAVLAL